MPGPQDSSPNFDFLSNDADEESVGWSPHGDSAVDMADPPKVADEEAVESPAGEASEDDAPATTEEASPTETAAETDSSVPDFGGVPETSDEEEPSGFPGFAPAEDEDADEGLPTFEMPTQEIKTDEQADKPAAKKVESVDASAKKEQVAQKKVDASAAVAGAAAGATAASRSRGRSSRSSSKKSDSGFTLSGPIAISLVSYAFMMTMLAMYLLFGMKSDQLESLPDIAPIGEEEFRYIPETANVAPGHRLKLGDAVRFGHIRVEPVRVTMGTASLTHYSGSSPVAPPEAGEQVLKLWLKLTNESSDQKIRPFDRRLVYDRRMSDNFDLLSDQFVVPADKLGAADPNVPMYDLSPVGEWDLEGQAFPQLKPGESVTTFLAAGPDELEQLTGQSVWRILMRKGFNNRSGNGVLTLIEVEFDAATATKES